MLYKFNHYTLDTFNYKLYLDREDKAVSSDPKLLSLLTLLLERYPVTVEKSEIIDRLWKGRVVTGASLSRVISDLRHLLGDDGKSQQIIRTVHGKGFRFQVKPRVAAKLEVSGRWYQRIPRWCRTKPQYNRRLYYTASIAPLFFLMVGIVFFSSA